MYNTASRFFGSFTRAGLFVALAASTLVLTPSVASATMFVCYGGNCTFWHGSCSSRVFPSSMSCVDVVAAQIVRDGSGASIIHNGKMTPIVSDRDEETVLKLLAVPPSGLQPSPSLQKELDAVFRSSDRRVSDKRLKIFSEELKQPIGTKP
jgi:hypothetical protein